MHDPKDHHGPIDGLEPFEPSSPADNDFHALDPAGRVDVRGALKTANEMADPPADAFDTHEPTQAEPVDAVEAIDAASGEPVDALDALAHYRGEPDEPVEAKEALEAIDVEPEGRVEALEDLRVRPIAAIEASHPAPPPRPNKPSSARGLATGFALGILATGLGVGLAYALLPKPTPVAPDAEPSTALVARIDGLRDQVEALSKGLKELKDRVDGLPKPPPAADLGPIEARIDAMAKRLDAAPAIDLKPIEEKVAGVVGEVARLEALTARVAGLEKALAAEQAVVDRLRAAPEPRPRPAPAAVGSAAADYSRAVDLYKQGQYDQALVGFVRLQQASPDDARVWYFSALSSGLATGQWAGDPERYVAKGVDRERAGTPDAGKIDAAFSEVAPPAVKTWLDAWRARAR